MGIDQTMSLPSWCYPESSYLPDNAVSVEEGELLLREALHPSAVLFLKSLNLSWIHPYCNSFTGDDKDRLERMAKLTPPHSKFYYHVNSLPTVLITLYKQVVPALIALSELWLRLLAFYVTPLCICYLIHLEVVIATTRTHTTATTSSCIISLAGLASAAVLLTDPLYVHEFGRSFGAVLFGTMCLLTIRQIIALHTNTRAYYGEDGKNKIKNNNNGEARDVGRKLLFRYWWYGLGLIMVFCQVTFHLVLCPEETLPDIPQHEPGLYYDKSNHIMADIAKQWPQHLRTYEKNAKTPWTITGDSRTGIPFLVNDIPKQRYHRVWVPSDVDEGEANALDIALPPNGELNEDKPFYGILHGLNGGSNEEYVKEFVMQQTHRGSTVAVMIARGLMGTPVIGKHVFHGARVSDIDKVAKVLKQQLGETTILVGVGYSMGGIIISNYVARYGASCHLDAAVAVSGGLDMREQINFHRSMRLWQPMLAQGLRDTIMNGVRHKYEERLTEEQFLLLLRASHVTDIDEHAVVTYNGFDNIMHYYSEMSAMGDWSSEESAGRIANVSIPFCVIHALDDPLITWRAAVGADKPESVVNSGKGYLMILLTKSGGHVGWPMGINPKNYGWEWMNGAVAGFVDAFVHVSKNSVVSST